MLFTVESRCCHEAVSSAADFQLDIFYFFYKSAVYICQPFMLSYLYIFSLNE